jgi:hypothetical protein
MTRWVFEISDDGPGFDWRRFLDFDPERAFAPNGRGIALSRQLSFSSLTYISAGQPVVVTVPRSGRIMKVTPAKPHVRPRARGACFRQVGAVDG